jgi:integrase/recombinase XerD
MPKFVPMSDLKGYLEPEQVKRIIECATNLRDKALLQLMWATGARVSEILSLKVSDLIWDENIVIIPTLKKGASPERRVSVNPKTMQLLSEYIQNYRLKKNDTLFPITRQRVFQIVREAGKRAGIDKVGEKPLHPHHLRHSHAVAWIRRDNTMEGLRKLQQRLGHTSISTTAFYLQFAPTSERDKKTLEVFE